MVTRPRNLLKADPYFDSVTLLAPFSGEDADTSASDLSNSGHTLTFNGTAALDGDIRKFGFTSLLLDGNSDYVTAPSSSDFEFGTGDFTIETWVRFATVSGTRSLISNYVNGGVHGFSLQWRLDGGARWAFYYGNTQLMSWAATPNADQWYHVAVARSGTSLKLFIDGTERDSVSNSTNMSSTTALTVGKIGDLGSQYFHGYIENVRITKGVARYTATFTPPERAYPTVQSFGAVTDPNFNSVVLLVDFDGADEATSETDVSNSAHSLTFNGTTKLDNVRGANRTGQTTSLLCNGGSSDNVTIAATSDFDFSTGDFTVECDVYFDNALSSENNEILATSSVSTGWGLGKVTGGSHGTMRFRFGSDSFTALLGPLTPAASTWHTMAVSKVGSNVYLFFNGTLLSTSSVTLAGPTAGARSLYIGTNSVNTFDEMDGAIGNVRITKGVGRYTTAYTPSSDPYPTS